MNTRFIVCYKLGGEWCILNRSKQLLDEQAARELQQHYRTIFKTFEFAIFPVTVPV